MNIRTLKYIFIIIGLIYLLSPIDFLPDLFGLIGRLDDVALIGFLVWKYKQIKNRLSANFEKAKKDFNSETSTNSNSESRNNSTKKTFCPYDTLKVSKNASQDEIKKAYKKMIKEYHPDKVEHLGEDLKELANNKIRDIQRAYEELSGG